MPLIDQACRAAASTRYVPVPEDLRDIVAEVWIQAYDDAIRAERRRWRIVPDAQPHLIVHRALDATTRGPRVVGARSTWLDARVAARAWSAGVTLRSGALPALAGLPASDLLDRSAAATAVWGPAADRVTDEVALAASPDDAITALLRFVRERAGGADGRGVDWRIRGFVARAADPAAGGVGDIAAALGVSPRSLRQTWRAEVGLSPREALSVERIHRSVDLALAAHGPSRRDIAAAGPGRRGTAAPGPGHRDIAAPGPGHRDIAAPWPSRHITAAAPMSWSRVARAAGYYDQAHLIRDFRRYLGETPERFLARGDPARG